MSISIHEVHEALSKIIELKENDDKFSIECSYVIRDEVKVPLTDELNELVYEALIGDVYEIVASVGGGQYAHTLRGVLSLDVPVRQRTEMKKRSRITTDETSSDDIELDEAFAAIFRSNVGELQSIEINEIKTYRVMVKTSVYSEVIVTAQDESDAEDLAVEVVRDNLTCDYDFSDDNCDLQHIEVCDTEADQCTETDDC